MKIALVGNQNSGKTTLFNTLTGSNQKIGNWPGVTVERKSGIIKNTSHELIDLPGVYSLFAYTEEEKVTRDFVLTEDFDLIINIVDATNLERSLYLTTQLMELDVPIVLALNMVDILYKRNIKINIDQLEKELGLKIIEISALKGIGINELIETLHSEHKVSNVRIYDDYIENQINERSKDLTKHKRYYGISNLESSLTDNIYDDDMDSVIANQRYDFIVKVKEKCVDCSRKTTGISDTLDKVFLNKWSALPIFALIMFGIYYLSVGFIGSATVDLVDTFISKFGDKVADLLIDMNTSGWLVSLIVDGIIAGVGAVLNFVPQLIILFLCISLLETTGYMSRITFVLDVIFRKFGLSGKSLIPFIVGSGCSVPGIMSARTIENKNEREMSIILTPFIPCSAKLPIIALFAGMFFDNKSGVVSASLYFLAILIILILALILRTFVYKNDNNSFISELPEYKLPNIKYILKDVLDKTISFIRRAGSVILIASIVLWFLLSFSFKLKYGVDVEDSILAGIGKIFSWVFYPILGEFSWSATVSAIQGLVAKEQVVSSMSVIANMSSDSINSSLVFNKDGIFGFFTPVSAYAFVVFNLFSAPCFGAIGAMKKELGSMKKTILAITLQTSVAWVIAFIVKVVGTIIVGG